MEVVVLADVDTRAAWEAFASTGVEKENIVEAEAPGPAMDALRAGKRVVTGSYTLAAQLETVNIITDVTPSPAIGAETARAGIRNGKDVVLVNIEADVTVGRVLKKLAQDAGVLYSVSSGDGSSSARAKTTHSTRRPRRTRWLSPPGAPTRIRSRWHPTSTAPRPCSR
jgi:predicted homoserine dehydrogenase-like protein